MLSADFTLFLRKMACFKFVNKFINYSYKATCDYFINYLKAGHGVCLLSGKSRLNKY